MLRPLSLACSLSTCLAACPGATKSDTTTDASTGTASATSTATSGDTAEAPTTDAAATSTTGAAMRACDAYAAADLRDVEQFCPCGVELGSSPDVATCIAEFQADREAYAACLCALETDDLAHAEYITCQTDALVAYTTCVSSLSCDEYDTQPEWDCSGIFLDAYDACDKAFRASTLAVETQCEDIQPFTCSSGELVPWSFVCDGEPDCMDMSDESDAQCHG